MLQTLIVLLLVLGAVAVLASAWWTGRQDRDPASSVDSFHRAMSAMSNTSPGAPRADDRAEAPAEEAEAVSPR